MAAYDNVKDECIRFNAYAQETKQFLDSIFNSILESGSSPETSALWKDVTGQLKHSSNYCLTLYSTLSASKEPLQLEFLANEFRRNVNLIKQQRERFIFETVSLFLGVPGSNIANMEKLESEYWDMKVTYDNMRQRGGLQEDFENAWTSVETNWTRLKETHETVREEILQHRYSMTHLKLLAAYLAQSGNKMTNIKTNFGKTIAKILLKDMETLGTLERETGPIYLERAFYNQTTKSYLSYKERLIFDLERAWSGEVISIQNFSFSMEVMAMILMEIMMNSNMPHLHERALRYEPGAFLGNLEVTTGQLVDLLRRENDVIIACVMDCLTALKKVADTLDEKGFDAAVNEEYRQQMVSVQEYSQKVLEELALRAELLSNDFGLEHVATLQTIWKEKLFKHETIKKLDGFVRYLCNGSETKMDDNIVSVSTIARSLPAFSGDDRGREDRWCFSEEFILGIIKAEPLSLQVVKPSQEVTPTVPVPVTNKQRPVSGSFRDIPSKIPQRCKSYQFSKSSAPKSRPMTSLSTAYQRPSKIPVLISRLNKSAYRNV